MTTGKSCDPALHLADNIVYFARTLRKAGLKLGPASINEAVQSIMAIEIGSRDDFYWTLHSVLVMRHEDHGVFDEAFRLFWRSRDLVEKMIAMFSPVAMENEVKKKSAAGQKRVNDAFFDGHQKEQPHEEKSEIEIDARETSSEREVLRALDFAQMSVEELNKARQEIAKLDMQQLSTKTRRFEVTQKKIRIDQRATLRAAMKTGGVPLIRKMRKRKEIKPPIVVIADISGSMSQYTRIFLAFVHALSENQHRVHSFLFGTRLTNITRQIRHKDVDEAMSLCSDAVEDWSGGTRIGETLHQFNKQWSRRVLGQGAIVLLISDGLERDSVAMLGKEMERLQKSCRRLIWLNPLLRFDAFEPKAKGVVEMLAHVDEFRAVHNLNSLQDLVLALSNREKGTYDPRRFGRMS